MYPISDFLRGPLCKPSVEVQEMAAFMSLWENYDPAFYHSTIESLEKDEQMMQHRTNVCLRIARVVPNECGDRKQELWIVQANDRRDVGIYCTDNEWFQLQHSCEHAKKCE